MPFKDLPMILMLIFQFPARVIARGEMNSCPPGMSVPCRLVVHDGAGSLLRIPDSWDGTRLHPPGYWKRANKNHQCSPKFVRVIGGVDQYWNHFPGTSHSWESRSVSHQWPHFYGEMELPVAELEAEVAGDSSIFSQWIPAIPSPLLLVLRGFTMFYMGF